MPTLYNTALGRQDSYAAMRKPSLRCLLMQYAPRSILALDLSPFGQSFELLAAIRALRTSYPQAFIVAAASSGACELLSAYGLVDDVIALGVIKLPDAGPSSPIRRLFRLVRRSRRYNFDLVLDFSPRLETQIVSRLLRSRVLTPLKLPRVLGMLLDVGGLSGSYRRSAGSNYASVLSQAGVEINDLRFAITPSAEEDLRFEERLQKSGSRGGELIVLLYASNPEGRRGWPVASFGEIGARLANNFNARIVAADEPSDRVFGRAVGALLPPGAIELSEPRALELLAAIARASVVITDEPALARIASELSTPVIEVAETITAAAASAPSHRIAQGSSRSRVSADEVYEIASEMIQGNRSPSLFHRP